MKHPYGRFDFGCVESINLETQNACIPIHVSRTQRATPLPMSLLVFVLSISVHSRPRRPWLKTFDDSFIYFLLWVQGWLTPQPHLSLSPFPLPPPISYLNSTRIASSPKPRVSFLGWLCLGINVLFLQLNL